MTRALVAVDLDQTVVYSERAAGLAGPSITVEQLDGRRLSSMTTGAHRAYAVLTARHRLVPVTTRTREQLGRITLPAPAEHAVCANGGILLHHGEPDLGWARWVAEICGESAPLPEVETRLRAVEDQDWVRLVRTAEELFVYLVADAREGIPDDWLTDLRDELGGQGWGVSVQGRKVYAVPHALSKAAAVARLQEQLGDDVLLAAGDSLLDQPLLELAARSGGAIRPAHGELHDLGWTGAHLTQVHVTQADGARAGEELLLWLTARADAGLAASTPSVRDLPQKRDMRDVQRPSQEDRRGGGISQRCR